MFTRLPLKEFSSNFEKFTMQIADRPAQSPSATTSSGSAATPRNHPTSCH
jgi:hypothetical protein